MLTGKEEGAELERTWKLQGFVWEKEGFVRMRFELALKGLIGFSEQTLGRHPQAKSLHDHSQGKENRKGYLPGRLWH